jgi:ATP-binding cassette subfamily B protein
MTRVPAALHRLRRRIRRTLWQSARPMAATPAPLVSSDDEPHYRPINRQLIRRMLTWLKPYRRHYALGILVGVVMVALEMQGPQFMRGIINLATGYVARTLDPPLTEAQAVGRLARLVGLWALVLGISVALHRTTILIMTGAGERVQFDLRRAMFAQLQRLSLSYYDRTKLGRIISRCTSDVNSLREMNVWGIDTVVKNALIMLFAGAMLLQTELRLFLAVAWLAPILYVANLHFRRKIGTAWQVAREGWTRVSTNLAENITGVRVVSAFNRQTWNLRTFDRLQAVNTANCVRAARINAVFQPTLQLIGFTGRAIILLYGGYLATTGAVRGIGAVVAAFLYWDLFMGPILSFGNFHNQLMMAMAGAERVFDLLDTKPDVADVPDAKPLPRIGGHVRFEHVTFGYKPDRPVLHDIDFEALPGQTVALVGPTGSGKTTIVSLIARFYQPQQGRILVDGQDIRLATGDSLHRQMGMVLQMNFLFTGTVLDNIRYVRPQATDEEVVAAARAIGSYDPIAALADGFRTQVGERGGSLSVGQRQLVCFTRAFLADPRIFLLDEATSSVDSVTELAVQRSLERLLEGRTTFVVAHRLSTIFRADCILVIDQGRIIERGTHAELLRAGGKYAALYQQFVFSSTHPRARQTTPQPAL